MLDFLEFFLQALLGFFLVDGKFRKSRRRVRSHGILGNEAPFAVLADHPLADVFGPDPQPMLATGARNSKICVHDRFTNYPKRRELGPLRRPIFSLTFRAPDAMVTSRLELSFETKRGVKCALFSQSER